MPPDLFTPILHGHCPSNTSNSTKCENDATIFRVSEDGRRRFTCVQPVRSNATKECKSIILGLDRVAKPHTDQTMTMNCLCARGMDYGKMWYPCGSFKGDDKSAALCQSYAADGLFSGISKNQLDAGVGGSLFRDKDRLIETVVRGYPQLRKDRNDLEFGYKLSYTGLSKEQEKISVVEVKEQKGLFQGLFGN